MRKKISKPTIESRTRPKTLTPLQSIQDAMGWKKVRVADEIIDHLCDFLLEWSLKEDSIYLVSGLKKFGMPRFKFYEWLPKSEKLRTTHEIVKDNIGENIFRLGMFRKIEASMAQRILPQFAHEFAVAMKDEKEFKKELATLRSDSVKNILQDIQFVERTVKDTDQVKETVNRAKQRKK